MSGGPFARTLAAGDGAWARAEGQQSESVRGSKCAGRAVGGVSGRQRWTESGLLPLLCGLEQTA